MINDMLKPNEILEQLANKAIMQIEKSSLIGFQGALDELIDFHRFLIDAYAIENGQGQSYAEIGDFIAQFKEWISIYRSIYTKAVNKLSDDPEFFQVLLYLPLRLFRTKTAHKTPQLSSGLLDLQLVCIHQLEAWLTRKTIVESTLIGLGRRKKLAGTDQRAYENIILPLIGASESFMQSVPSIFKWKENSDSSPDERWGTYRQSWPIISQHLRTCAYMVVISIWNSDLIGEDRFIDALIRWGNLLEFQLSDASYLDHTLRNRHWVTPDLLNQSWESVVRLLPQYAQPQEYYNVNPEGVLKIILRRAYDDTVLVTSAILVNWYIKGMRKADLTANAALRLMQKNLDVEDGAVLSTGGIGERINFIFWLKKITYLNDASGYFEDAQYGGWIDGLISMLDGMTERSVVPGRTYTPSTCSSRSDLNLPFIGILLSAVSDATAAEVDNFLTEYLSRISNSNDYFNVIQRFVRFAQNLASMTKTVEVNEIKPIFEKFSVGQDFDISLKKLTVALTTITDTLSVARTEKFKALPIDLHIVENVRVAVEQVVKRKEFELPVFAEVLVSIDPEAATTEKEFSIRFQGGRGNFTSPQVDPTGDSVNSVVQHTRELMLNSAWQEFLDMKCDVHLLSTDEAEYWRAIAELSQPFTHPTLLVSNVNTRRDLYLWRFQPEIRPDGIDFVENEDVKSRGGHGFHYLGTIGRVDVFGTNLPVGHSILFSADILETAQFAPFDDGRIVEVTVSDLEEAYDASISVKYKLGLSWKDIPIYDLIDREVVPVDEDNM